MNGTRCGTIYSLGASLSFRINQSCILWNFQKMKKNQQKIQFLSRALWWPTLLNKKESEWPVQQFYFLPHHNISNRSNFTGSKRSKSKNTIISRKSGKMAVDFKRLEISRCSMEKAENERIPKMSLLLNLGQVTMVILEKM